MLWPCGHTLKEESKGELSSWQHPLSAASRNAGGRSRLSLSVILGFGIHLRTSRSLWRRGLCRDAERKFAGVAEIRSNG